MGSSWVRALHWRGGGDHGPCRQHMRRWHPENDKAGTLACVRLHREPAAADLCGAQARRERPGAATASRVSWALPRSSARTRLRAASCPAMCASHTACRRLYRLPSILCMHMSSTACRGVSGGGGWRRRAGGCRTPGAAMQCSAPPACGHCPRAGWLAGRPHPVQLLQAVHHRPLVMHGVHCILQLRPGVLLKVDGQLRLDCEERGESDCRRRERARLAAIGRAAPRDARAHAQPPLSHQRPAACAIPGRAGPPAHVSGV
jgi:hypothetical protein